jgi:hypothetical protein
MIRITFSQKRLRMMSDIQFVENEKILKPYRRRVKVILEEAKLLVGLKIQ